MEKGSTIERTSGVRLASKNQGVGKKVFGKGTVCTGKAEQRK